MDAAGEEGATDAGATDVLHSALLTAKGVTHSFKPSDGRHEWTVWRHQLNEIALLFK
jgi:enterochelin esterase-like enzyme